MTDPNLDQLELLAHLERLREKYGRPGETPESLVERLEATQAEIGELLTFERLRLGYEQ
jgi:hypothetical protein